jgi:hypothetical protein
MAIRKSSNTGTPFGQTSDRPSSPAIGQTFYNGSNGLLEIYTTSGWIALAGAPPAIPVSVSPTNQGSGRAYNNGSASVAFTNGTGGGLSGEYIVTSTPGNYFAVGSESPITVTGLQSNTSYTFAAQARNNFGTSISSTSSESMTATTVPQAPSITGVTDTTAGGTVSLSFTASATGGSSITNYKYSTDGTTFTALSPSQTTSPLTISGLTNGTSYTFYIKAVNANGDSTSSSISSSVTPTLVLQNTYLVVGGGGAGGSGLAGGGGAGGYRTNYSVSTIAMPAGVTFTATVGGGGAGNPTNQNFGADGVASSLIGGSVSVSSAGGGGGGYYAGNNGRPGGSGGGGGGTGVEGTYSTGGSGNTPSTSPSQGNNGGRGTYWGNSQHLGGGGGGAGAGGSDTPNSSIGGGGGAGSSNLITGSSVAYAGGGGGSGRKGNGSAGGAGGSSIGGIGAGTTSTAAGSGTTNTGSGGGGGDWADGGSNPQGGNGGSGIVIIRTLGTAASTTGSPTVTTDGSHKVYKFTSTGTITF